MKFFITGIAGFAGSCVAESLFDRIPGTEIVGMDNFSRPGSERNRLRMIDLGVRLIHGDIRNASDLEEVPAVDFVIDAAANPSVLAGTNGHGSSRQLVEHNLLGTLNLLEFCKKHHAGFILLSTSRVYSIDPLVSLRYTVQKDAFEPATDQHLPAGLSRDGLQETFYSSPPLSLYGATKKASEQLALEYGQSFGFPVWINRCGVLAGAGQFGRPDQGIFSFWIHSYRAQAPLRYIGFEGKGHQVRDCLHPRDLGSLIATQIRREANGQRIFNASGGKANAMSLRQLTDWCAARFPKHEVAEETSTRTFDVPWMILDASSAKENLQWVPETSLDSILNEIADHAETNPDWLRISAA